MIVVNNRITPLDGMIISAIKDIQSERVVFKNIAFDQVVAIEDMHGNTFAKQPQIIYCKDCKYADEYCHCSYTTWWNSPNDFCSMAERQEE